jgi:hypothetical protein
MDDDVKRRVLKAYFKRFGKNAVIPSQDVDMFEKEGKKYVRLFNVNGILAVYQVKPKNNGDFALKYVKSRCFYE